MKELFTGKNKIEFQVFYVLNYLHHNKNTETMDFNALPFGMRSGVIDAYYDSVGLDLDKGCEEQNYFLPHVWGNGEKWVRTEIRHGLPVGKYDNLKDTLTQLMISADGIMNEYFF